MRIRPRDPQGQRFAVYDPRGGGNAHIDVVLSNISIAWPNEGLVGEGLFPTVQVRKQSDKYYVFGREAWSLNPGGDVRAPGTEANEIPGIAVSTDTYFAQEHALQIAVTDEERENVDSPLSPDRDGTELVTSKILLGRELAMKDMVQLAANYPSDHVVTLSGTAQWNDYTNSDPIANIRAGVRKIHAKMFLIPNTIVIPWQVMSQLEDHPDFIERIKYSERGVVTAEIVAGIIGIANVIVPGVGYNTNANPGVAASLGYVWGKDVLLAWVPPRAGMRVPAFGYEFVWGYGGGRAQAVERWREERRKSDVIRVSRRYDLKMTALDASGDNLAGYLIKAAIA
jgi:hypothetical protein